MTQTDMSPVMTGCRTDILAARPLAERQAFLNDLSDNALAAFPHLWEMWARRESQLPPEGPWTTWLLLGGRGAGKTRAGAEWVRSQVEGPTPLAGGQRRRIALIAETADQARDVMVLGESGLLAIAPPDRRPVFRLSRRTLDWPNGAQASLFSASDPESLRGPQFDGAWCDELGKWRRAEAAWDMLQLGLRLGDAPRQVVTTTPRANPVLMSLLDDPSTAITRAPSRSNAAHLAPGFLARMNARYGGCNLGRQELDGELLFDLPGALWSRALIDSSRIKAAPPLDRIVVAVDPPVTGHKGSDACGIIVAGRVAQADAENASAVILADWSIAARSPAQWAARAVAAYHTHQADRLIAEVNQGGDLVEDILRQVDGNISYQAVRATRGKRIRAEPVAALYEQGRINHISSGLNNLEDQMCAFGADRIPGQTRSPDRVDALVWAVTALLLSRHSIPRVRGL